VLIQNEYWNDKCSESEILTWLLQMHEKNHQILLTLFFLSGCGDFYSSIKGEFTTGTLNRSEQSDAIADQFQQV